MYQRLKYLYLEGFEVCSLMGYDSRSREDVGEGTILYRMQLPDGSWQMRSETFAVTHDEIVACSTLYLSRIFK